MFANLPTATGINYYKLAWLTYFSGSLLIHTPSYVLETLALFITDEEQLRDLASFTFDWKSIAEGPVDLILSIVAASMLFYAWDIAWQARD